MSEAWLGVLIWGVAFGSWMIHWWITEWVLGPYLAARVARAVWYEHRRLEHQARTE